MLPILRTLKEFKRRLRELDQPISIPSVTSPEDAYNDYKKSIREYSYTSTVDLINKAIAATDKGIHARLLVNPNLTALQFKTLFPDPSKTFMELLSLLPVRALMEIAGPVGSGTTQSAYILKVLGTQAYKLDEEYLIGLVASTRNRILLDMIANLNGIPETVKVIAAMSRSGEDLSN